METRPFGKTGESMPILSFGSQRIVDDEGCNQDQALAILNTALDRGIRYFDTAWTYSRGQSEERVGMMARHRRQEMWIATKTWDTTRDGARRQLEDSLTRLQTDHVDEWRLHNVWDFERLDKMTGPGGALEAAIQARDEGLVRFLSISGHTNPQVQIEALRRFPFDTVLVAVSVLDHFIYSFAEEFLPVAARCGAGVVGMKVFGHKKLRELIKTPLLQMEHIFGLEQHVDYIANGGTDFVRTGVYEDGGITGAMKVAHAAEGFGLDVEFHGGGLAHRHCIAAIRNTNYYELGLLNPKIKATKPPIYPPQFVDELENIDQNGHVAVPQGPGLGAELDWDYIQRHQVNVVVYD